MCGIAGVIAWANPYRTSRETLSRMSASIAHRGPDGEGLYLNHEGDVSPSHPQAALAFRRLAILDPDPRAMQPFHLYDAQGNPRLTLTFNGEIYNFRDLRNELTKLRPDYHWRTTGDTEVLLLAYDTWREHCLEKLNGMFAFAVWDEQKKELFLARDRMGQKPLYIAQLRGDHIWLSPKKRGRIRHVTAFASELPALVELTWVNRSTNPEAVFEYLSWGYIPPGWTIYKGIAKLGPGSSETHAGTWSRGGRYFDASDRFDESAQPATSEVAKEVRDRIHAAVRRQMISDVPIGCFLSGGIDSSVVAASMVAAAGSPKAVSTFSVGFDDPRFDETPYARQVAAHLGTDHHEFRISPDAAADLPRLAAVFGEPFGDSSALPTHYLSRETRDAVKVALSGDGGDELFGGYDRYRAMLIAERLSRLPPGARSLVSTRVARLIPGTHPKSRLTRLKRFLNTLGSTASERYDSIMRIFSRADVAALLGRPLPHADQLLANIGDRLADQRERHARDVVQAALAVDRVTYLPGDLLTKVDRASMLHNLEVRSPFMDHDLVRFASTLTTDQLLKGGPKRMLREAFAADLPDFVFKRKKMGFAVPIGDWLRTSLRPMLHDHLFATNSFARAHFNMDVVRKLVDDHETGRADHSQRLYALLMLELWHALQ